MPRREQPRPGARERVHLLSRAGGDDAVGNVDRDRVRSSLSRLWDEIDDAEVDDDSRRRAIIDRAIGEIFGILTLHWDPEVLYLLGYASYVHPDRRASRELQEQVDRALRCVLRVVPQDPLSLLYLGHNDYDLGRFESARVHLAAIDDSGLEPWLRIKVCEMKACCCLRLSGVPECQRAVGELVERCGRHPDLMRVDPPLNLLRLLEQMAIEHGSACLELLREPLTRLDQLCRVRWFSELLDPSAAG